MPSFFTQTVLWRNTLFLKFFPKPKKNIELPLNYIPGEAGQCGLACTAMVIEIFTQKYINVDELSKHLQNHRRYYLDKIGWTHHGLVDLLAKNGIYAKVFRWKTLQFVLDNIYRRRLVIVSLSVPGASNCSQSEPYEAINPKLPVEQHLCVVYGYRDGKILLHDPRALGIYAQIEITLDRFVEIFTGNGVQILDQIR